MSEISTDRARRLMRLPSWLLANSGVTVAEAARQFNVSVETIVDDLRILLVTGHPARALHSYIDIQFWRDEDINEDDDDISVDPTATIHVRDALGLSHPLKLTVEQLEAITEQLTLLSGVYGGVAPAIDSALEKFRLRLALQQRTNAKGQYDDTQTRRSPVSVLRQAAADGSCVMIRYAADGSDEVTQRVIQPVRVIADADRTYVDAWCHQQEAMRMFRVDRITACGPSPALPRDLTAVDTSERPPVPTTGVTVEFAIERSGRWILQEYACDDIVEHPDGRITARLTTGGLEWAAGWLLQHAGTVTGLGPAEAVELAAERARSALQQYSDEVTV